MMIDLISNKVFVDIIKIIFWLKNFLYFSDPALLFLFTCFSLLISDNYKLLKTKT